jgi:hypothetical protein
MKESAHSGTLDLENGRENKRILSANKIKTKLIKIPGKTKAGASKIDPVIKKIRGIKRKIKKRIIALKFISHHVKGIITSLCLNIDNYTEKRYNAS